MTWGVRLAKVTWLWALVLLGLTPHAQAQDLKLPPPLPALAPPPSASVELGRMLFFDRRLSGDGTMNCATCHIPRESFADGQALSSAYPTNKHWRHTPSLLNVGYLQTFFWDGRSQSLEDQARGPIHSSFEMNLNLDYLVAKLREIPGYARPFREFSGAGLSAEQIIRALADFERTLTVTDSPFDRFLAGDAGALTPAAQEGAAIFFGTLGGCSVCHAGPLLSDQQFHSIGIGETPDLVQDPLRRATRNFFLGQMGLPPADRDPGRYAVSKNPADLARFRTPPLRQVADTAPYMHNGSVATLADVVELFSRDRHTSPGPQPFPSRPLSATEKESLLAFLQSLSGTLPVIAVPRLPGE